MKSDSTVLPDVFRICFEHYNTAKNLPTGKIKNPNEILREFDFEIKKNPADAAELFKDMQLYLKLTPNTLTPNFQNQLFSGLNQYALAGDWLTSVTNTTMATFEVSPMGTLVEKKLIEHMNRLVGWENGDGTMATGGSNANMISLLVARNKMFPEIKKEGQLNKRLIIFVSEDAHYSFEKAANILGIGLDQVKKIKTNPNGEMEPSHLEEMARVSLSEGEYPFFVAATAGTTVLGSFDPIDRIHEISKKFNLWLHVDGAWGGSVLLSSRHRHHLKGIENVDSMTWDTHKMIGTGLMSSFFLTKHNGILRSSHNHGGEDYIFHESEIAEWDSGPSSLQCGRRSDALKVWLTWRSLGDLGIEIQIDNLFTMAIKAKEMILEYKELELMYEPSSLNICFRYRSVSDVNTLNKKIRHRLLEEGNFFINIATRKKETFFRLIIVHPDLNETHLYKLFSDIIRLGNKIKEETEFCMVKT
ncbi:pyridoxal phosphate-dependent decarboxylase family protein [Leptospira vanthielii]|uniref:Glutamate decarboxylase n=1 Tax=Leptospira vanthielii TaxID=293085 RepID=A0ABY2NQ59_9LEPT|nr:pyridoxal-dependent decarboxylase [Leptospira vanthielii]TGM58240.1 glutamate decarboxylase [Leptospira vanthielii]